MGEEGKEDEEEEGEMGEEGASWKQTRWTEYRILPMKRWENKTFNKPREEEDKEEEEFDSGIKE